MFGSGFTTLIISNEEMEDIMKIRYHEISWNVITDFRGQFVRVTGKGAITAGEGTIRTGETF